MEFSRKEKHFLDDRGTAARAYVVPSWSAVEREGTRCCRSSPLLLHIARRKVFYFSKTSLTSFSVSALISVRRVPSKSSA